MRRSHISLFSWIALVALIALVACGGGGSSSSKTPSKIVTSPTTATVQQGGTFQVSAIVQDDSGNGLSAFTAKFTVLNDKLEAGTNLISVSINGGVCAGNWDSLTTPVVCTPTTGTGKAYVRAFYNDIKFDMPVYVYSAVDNIAVTPVSPACASAAASKAETQAYTVTASYKGKAVTIPAPAFSWSDSDGGAIGTVAGNTNDTDTPGAVVTAVRPGVTQVFARIGNIVSTPASFTTCPVQQITIKDSNGATSTSTAINTAGSSTLTPTVTDSKGNALTAANLNLTWTSSQPAAASVSSGGVITANAASGWTSVIATCEPPSCNKGLGGIYSNVYLAKVAGTTTSTTIYVGSKDSTSIYPITSTSTTPGTAITIGAKPNSMVFNGTGSSLYIGTDSGLVVLTTSSNSVTSPLTGLPGKILAISQDGSSLLISNVDVVTDKSKSQVFLYAATAGTVQTINVPNATAAAFSPDNTRLYILGNGKWTPYFSGVFPTPQTLVGANSVDFLATGAFGAIAASGTSLGVKATCNDADKGTIATSGTPTLVAHMPDGQHLVAASSSHLDYITLNSDNKGFVNSISDCSPAITSTALNSFTTPALTPKQLIVTPDGTKVYVLSDLTTLNGFSVSGSTLTDATIQLSGSAAPTTGGVTLDSNFIWLGGSDGNVHKVDLNAKTDSIVGGSGTPVKFPITPDFVAVQPH